LGQPRRTPPRHPLREHDGTAAYGAYDGGGAGADNRGRCLTCSGFPARPHNHPIGFQRGNFRFGKTTRQQHFPPMLVEARRARACATRRARKLDRRIQRAEVADIGNHVAGSGMLGSHSEDDYGQHWAAKININIFQPSGYR